MTKPPLFSDLAQMASGAASAFGGVKGELDTIIQSQIEKILAKRGLVSREDFDASNARISALVARIEALEAQLAAMQSKQAPKAKKTAAKTKKS